ncbi:MAG: SDR family oxidoreductase [Spirochaetota bacterium]|nr:MAG: SDR family oxidoreductase [Spirochaetota bacterium]
MINTDLFNIKSKVALVTGASRGIGKAVAIGLAKAGANLIVCSHTSRLDDTVHIVKKIGVEILGVKADVSKESDVYQLVKQSIDSFGRIDILVNNAGVYINKDVKDFSEEEWDLIIDTNLKGYFLCARTVGREMIKQKSGKIINITSIAGLGAMPNTAVYAASKAGIIGLTKGLAVDWAKYNINVNAVAPGDVATEVTKEQHPDHEYMARVLNSIPMHRSAMPDELVGTIIFLASRASDYITGSLIVYDGGWTAMI